MFLRVFLLLCLAFLFSCYKNQGTQVNTKIRFAGTDRLTTTGGLMLFGSSLGGDKFARVLNSTTLEIELPK